MEQIRYLAEPYARERHEAFVKVSWCTSARYPWETLASRLRRPDTRCLVAHSPKDRDTFYGWAAVDDAAGAVIWVYVRTFPGRIRTRKLGTALLLELGHDVTNDPTPCLFWSPSAAEIVATGKWRAYYAPRTRRKEAA